MHQAPPKHLLPDNVRFKHLDLQEELPSEFIGRYDLIHARFLLGLVKNNDPLPLLQNLLKMLSTYKKCESTTEETSTQQA